MNSEKWQKIKEIFNAAVELAPAESEAFLQNQNGTSAEILEEVRKLLAAEKENHFEKPIVNLAHLWQEEATEDFVGRQIGNYKITSEIGRGGMGIVFKALRETADFSQTVALKLLKRGMDSDAMLRRFRHERQILASLEHPNIARLLDGGMSEDGLPFFAMEFVGGKPFDEFCEEKNLGVTERLRLFLQICAAVSFAHSRLVVHRDLKPTNILVTEDGSVKLLDFGIAKIISDEGDLQNQTVTTLGMMTPAYASPEQIRGEIVSTPSDIYSLGLILYELLTGASAYKFPNNRPDEIAKIICEAEPPRPSSVVSGQWFPASHNVTRENGKITKNPKTKTQNLKSLRGDLDNIILKALRKEPARRYASVEQFAGDIQRHLDGLPVVARPDTLSYRLEKFVSRNRVSVVVGVLLFLSLIGGIAATSWQAVRAERERAISEKRFNQVRELANNIVFKYYDEIEKFPDSTKLREVIVSDSLNYFDSLATDANADDALKSELARAYIRIGKVQGRAYFANLGNTSGAIENYRKGITLLEPLAAKSGDAKMNSDLINAYSEFSATLKRQGNAEESDAILRKSIALNEKLLQTKPEDVALSIRLSASYIYLGDSLPVGKDENENIAAYKRATGISEGILRRDADHVRANNLYAAASDRVATNLKILASDAKDDENPDTAKDLLREAEPIIKKNIEIAEKMLALEPNNVLNLTVRDAAYVNYGEFFFVAGDYDEALRLQIAAEKSFRKTAEKDINDLEQRQILATVLASLGATSMRLGNHAQSVRYFDESIKSFDELTTHDEQNFEYLQKRWEAKYFYADELLRHGETEKARQIYEKAFAEIDKAAHEKNTAYGESLRGFYYAKMGDCDLADSENANPADKKREMLQSAIDSYQKAAELWTQNGAQSVLGVRQNNKLEVLQRKISRLRQKIV